MAPRNEIPYETRIIDLLTHRRYSLAEVIARYSRANSVPLDEADAYIKQLIQSPTSNLRVEEDADSEASAETQAEIARAQIAAQTLQSAAAMLNSNIPAPPFQERLRRLAHAAVEDLEHYYFGGTEEAAHHHGHDHAEHHDHDHHDHDHHDHHMAHDHRHDKHGRRGHDDQHDHV